MADLSMSTLNLYFETGKANFVTSEYNLVPSWGRCLRLIIQMDKLFRAWMPILPGDSSTNQSKTWLRYHRMYSLGNHIKIKVLDEISQNVFIWKSHKNVAPYTDAIKWSQRIMGTWKWQKFAIVFCFTNALVVNMPVDRGFYPVCGIV